MIGTRAEDRMGHASVAHFGFQMPRYCASPRRFGIVKARRLPASASAH